MASRMIQNDDMDLEWTANDEAERRLFSTSDEHPLRRATGFFAALVHLNETNEIDEIDLAHLMLTTESRDAWGDLSAAAEFFRQIKRPAFSQAQLAEGAADVAYVKVVDVPNVVGYFTLVYRPEDYHPWRVHSFGEPVTPTDVPRSSPGTSILFD